MIQNEIKKENVILSNYNELQEIFANAEMSRKDKKDFSPPFELPKLNKKWEKFFSVANISYFDLNEYSNKKIKLLHLSQNKNTQTTKTLASLLMVARAVNFIHENDKGIILFTPSSGNKAIALRDAVERAITYNLVEKEKLRIITLIPSESKRKLRESILTENKELRKLNPTYVYKGKTPQDVKDIGQEFINNYKVEIENKYNSKIWYSLDINNYLVADALRALYVDKNLENNSQKTLHAHAVSSAYGLLGFNLGLEYLKTFKNVESPGYLLIQHLRTSDMVLNLLFNSFSSENSPNYQMNENGLFVQKTNPNFPYYTWDTKENLEPTFYSHTPPTSSKMNQLIKNNGGTGIVVSLYECINRFDYIKNELKETTMEIPNDLRDVREWSLIMAITGVLNSIDRNLIPDFDEIVIHVSGIYNSQDYSEMYSTNYLTIDSSKDIYIDYFNDSIS